MIGRLNHVAIAVPDLDAAIATYRDTLGAEVSEVVPQPEHGVNTVFVALPNTKVELLGVLGENSPIVKFLERNPDGGIHHVCYEVDDIRAVRDRLVAAGARVLGSGEPRIGAHGKPVLFLHPKDFLGTLVELEKREARPMGVTTYIAIYFIVWWTVIFAILPFGVRSQHEVGSVEVGSEPGAPVRPLLVRKALVTTVIAAVIVGLFAWSVETGRLTLDMFPMPFKVD